MSLNTLLKIFKGALNVFSIDNRAVNPNFEAHLFLLDKDTEFTINDPLFKEC